MPDPSTLYPKTHKIRTLLRRDGLNCSNCGRANPGRLHEIKLWWSGLTVRICDECFNALKTPIKKAS